MRGRLEEDPAFAAVTVESERIRLFNEHVSSLEVGIPFCPERFFHILRFIIVVLNTNHFRYIRSALLFLLTAILTLDPFLSLRCSGLFLPTLASDTYFTVPIL